ncbi:MAG: sensor histidine kinase [Crocinitomicaceae bacterium]|nr:sensor histidine kinase [Crocinitomicaceae bacterium]
MNIFVAEMPFFKPVTRYTNYFDMARFNLNWNINLFLAFALPVLAFALFLFDQPTYLPTLFGCFVPILILVILKTTGEYKTPSILFTVFGVVLCTYTLIGFPTVFHLVDTLWMVITVLYAFFTLGKVWGNAVLAVNSSAIIYFILVQLNYNMSTRIVMAEGELIALSFNTIICGLIISFLILQFIKTTQLAEENYLKTNSELTEKNKEVHQKNEEKTVMLKEIHHRVKNNLQVITSLLRLQSKDARDQNTIEMFKDSTNRVVAMALIHEKMYQNKDLSKINLEDYLKTLLKDLIDSYSVSIPIETTIKSDLELISNRSLVPLALLFNELASNSLKHAFVEMKNGSIEISVMKKNGKILIRYSDNGKWRDKQKESSFGLELIESLAEQLDGTIERKVENGTGYELVLPDNL